MTKITAIQGDITIQKVDAIVNAANTWLRGGGGVDGAIHAAAGSKLLEECITLGGCKTGEAKITKGYNLPAKYVIHTVGPFFDEEDHQMETLLSNCYRNSLGLAVSHKIRTIAFPAISTGVFRYPKDMAAKIALTTTQHFIREHPDSLDEVRFVLFEELNYNIYSDLLAQKELGK